VFDCVCVQAVGVRADEAGGSRYMFGDGALLSSPVGTEIRYNFQDGHGVYVCVTSNVCVAVYVCVWLRV